MGQPGQFCTGVCEEKFSWKGTAIQSSRPEAEEIVIVGAVTRKHLVTA
jgi:hypothetical protein